jgi:hypothetical protein
MTHVIVTFVYFRAVISIMHECFIVICISSAWQYFLTIVFKEDGAHYYMDLFNTLQFAQNVIYL